MKRLFRRPLDISKISPFNDAPQSDADLSYPSYESEKSNEFTLEETVSKQEQREVQRLHHRAWSLESDFRISRVILSPIISGRDNPVDLLPTTASMSSLASSITRLAPSHSFLSATSMRDGHDDASMPSWPSSILCRPEELDPDHSADHKTNMTTPQSSELPIATPKSSNLPAKPSPAIFRSPLTIDQAVQVDEFGRINLTISGSEDAHQGRQVRFKDTIGVASALVPTSPTVSSKSAGTIETLASRDTFGNGLDQEAGQHYTSEGSDDEAGIPLALDVHLSTPPLLSPFPLPVSVGRDGTSSTASEYSPVYCFPALCQAASSMSSLQDHLFSSTKAALLPPIELVKERPPAPNFVQAPKAYREDARFAPWRSSRQGILPASKSDGKLPEWKPTKMMRGRARAETSVDLTNGWNDATTHALPSRLITFPNPHDSVDLSSDQNEPFLSPLSTLASPSDGTQESNASVRSIIDQQRKAMDKLTQAGFWQHKASDHREQKSYHKALPSLPQKELMTKVSQWAWLLSSEAEKSHGEDDREVMRPSSPTDNRSDGVEVCQQEASSKKSWEWLASEEDFVEESFESNETVQDVTTVPPAAEQVGLGLDHSVALHQIVHLEGEKKEVDEEPPAQDDSLIIDTPELGQRESRTTAAIEALLTQIQRSQDDKMASSKSLVARKVGTSYLYHQILKNIAEEDDRGEGRGN